MLVIRTSGKIEKLTFSAILGSCIFEVLPMAFGCTALCAVVLATTLHGGALRKDTCISQIRVTAASDPNIVCTVVDHCGAGLGRWRSSTLIYRDTVWSTARFARRACACHVAAFAIGSGSTRSNDGISTVTFSTSRVSLYYTSKYLDVCEYLYSVPAKVYPEAAQYSIHSPALWLSLAKVAACSDL